MKRITNDMLERSLGLLREYQPWADYSLNFWNTPRTVRLEAKKGKVDISERGTNRDVYQYIRAMITALRMEEQNEINKLRQWADSECPNQWK